MPSFRYLARGASRILAGATDIREGEGAAVLASGGLFFLILAIVMILRPVREASGLESGIEGVRVLFFGTVAGLMVLFSVAESKRLFPAIAVGGTLGAIAGSTLSWQLASRTGTASLFLVAIVLLELAVWTAKLIARTRARRVAAGHEQQPIGGHFFAGVTALLRSPYLAGIGVFIALTAMISTLLYFTELRIVKAAAESMDQRTTLFAGINVWTQVATLVAQAFIAGRIMRFLSVGTALAVLPMYSIVGFAVLAAQPTLQTYTLVNAIFRAAQRGITRPARETLFTVLSREDKYKAKPCLDTLVCRTGDAAGAPAEGYLATLPSGGALTVGVVLSAALLWIVLSFVLGTTQSRPRSTEEPTRD